MSPRGSRPNQIIVRWKNIEYGGKVEGELDPQLEMARSTTYIAAEGENEDQ